MKSSVSRSNLKIQRPTNQECSFCQLGQGKVAKWYDTPLAETERFVAVPSLGALVPGWTLVLPKIHADNFGAFYCDSEFLELFDSIAVKVGSHASRLCFLEHGPTSHGSATGCGVNHAHVHLVPLDFSIANDVIDHAPELNWERVEAEKLTQYVSGSEYLAFSESVRDGIHFVNVAKLEVPRSQFFRRVIASKLGIPERFDYKRNSFIENIEKTYEMLNVSDHLAAAVG